MLLIDLTLDWTNPFRYGGGKGAYSAGSSSRSEPSSLQHLGETVCEEVAFDPASKGGSVTREQACRLQRPRAGGGAVAREPDAFVRVGKELRDHVGRAKWASVPEQPDCRQPKVLIRAVANEVRERQHLIEPAFAGMVKDAQEPRPFP